MNPTQQEVQKSMDKVEAIVRKRKANLITNNQCCGIVLMGKRKTRPCRNKAVYTANSGMVYCSKHIPGD